MKKKSLLTFLFVFIFSGCASQTERAVDPVFANNQFFTLGKNTLEIGMTASDNGIYWINDGALYYYDIQSDTEIKLSDLNYCDDTPCTDEAVNAHLESGEYTSIQVIPTSSLVPFIQYYDEYIYILSEDYRGDGSHSLNLIRLDQRGEGRETLISFNEIPYNLVINNSKLFYVSANDNRPYMIDFSTHEKVAIDLPSDQAAVAYTIDNQYVYLITSPSYSNPDSQSDPIIFTYYRFDTLSDTLSPDLKHPGHLLGVYDNLKLVGVTSDDKETITLIDDAGNELASINDVIAYNIYNDKIYAKDIQPSPNLIVWDLDGNQLDVIEPDSTIPEESLSTMTPIIGIVDNKALVGVQSSTNRLFYLVDLDTQEWIQAFSIQNSN